LHDFGLELSHFKNLIGVICTQFQAEPTTLERETNGAFKNYKIDVIVNPDGSLTRPYTLEEGISTTNIASELLEQAFSLEE